MRRAIALVAGFVAAASIHGQQPSQSETSAHADRAASRPSASIERIQDLPSGEGFAARYPGDQSIRRDPRTIFSEDFEGRDPFELWTDRKGPENVRLQDDDVHSGWHALAIDADMKT